MLRATLTIRLQTDTTDSTLTIGPVSAKKEEEALEVTLPYLLDLWLRERQAPGSTGLPAESNSRRKPR